MRDVRVLNPITDVGRAFLFYILCFINWVMNVSLKKEAINRFVYHSCAKRIQKMQQGDLHTENMKALLEQMNEAIIIKRKKKDQDKKSSKNDHQSGSYDSTYSLH
jgi:hypothetical protein